MAVWNPSPVAAVGAAIPVELGLAFGAWTSYTPTLGAWTLGSGTTSGSYARIDKLVFFRAMFTFGAGSAAASSIPTLTLPVTASAGMNLLSSMAWGTLYDAASSTYQATCRLVSTTTVGFLLIGSNGLHTTPSATTPFTWGTGDSLLAYGFYEAA